MNYKEIAEGLKALGLKKGSIVLLHSSFVSLGEVENGPQEVLKAFLSVIGKTGTLLVPVFGKLGILTEELKKQAASMPPESAEIIFTGKLSPEELANEYRTANVFTLPAIVDSKGDTEGLGVVLIEAMELGLPVVASNVGGIPDVVVDGVSGILVPEKSPEALASAFKKLSSDAGLVRDLLAGAQKRIAECFTWDGIIERQVQAYEKCLKK